MSLTSTTLRVSHNCNGVQTIFPFTFKIHAEGDLKVYLLDTVNDTTTLLTLTTHYSVQAADDDFSSGGNVITVSTYSSDYVLVIYREMALTQETDLTEGGPLPAETLESELDKSRMIDQQLSEKINRQLVAPLIDPVQDLTIPNYVDRASKLLGFDASGLPIAADGSSTVVSAWAATFVDDTSAAAARTTLDVYSKAEVDAKNPKGYFAISLTNYDNHLEPKIADGSVLEVDGAVKTWSSDTSITGWASIDEDPSDWVFIKIAKADGAASFTSTAPTWSVSKNGWYSGTDRYVFALRKWNGNYQNKININRIPEYSFALRPKLWKTYQGSGGDGPFHGMAAGIAGTIRYLASGNGAIKTSPDGLTWTTQTHGLGGSPIWSAEWANGVLMVGNANGQIAWSTDGTTWNVVAVTGFGTDDVEDLCFGEGMWVAIGDTGKISYSSDNGQSWTAATNPVAPANMECCAYGGGFFVSGGASGNLVSSPDGITWTSRTSGFGANGINKAAYGKGLMVIAGDAGNIATSPDGITWTIRTVPAATGVEGLVFFEGVFIALLGTNQLWFSEDGIHWSVATTTIGASNPKEAAFFEGRLVIGFNAGSSHPELIGDIIDKTYYR